MNINNIAMEMTPQEKEIYFAHMEKRAAEEQKYMQSRKAENLTYRERLIVDILKRSSNFTAEQLIEKPLRTLEIIASY